MNAKDLILLSIMAYKEKQFDGAAKLFTTAMETEGLDSLVDYVNRMPIKNAAHKNAGESDNTLAPSLASADYIESLCSNAELSAIVDEVEAVFRSESSLLDDGDVVVEALAENEEAFGVQEPYAPTPSFDEQEDSHLIIASAGPIRVK